jgi:mannose-6-phosphate isomerase
MPPDARYLEPWTALPNRVARFYRGGLLIDRLRGAARPADTNEPEDWIGSATRAWTPPGAPLTDEGLSEVAVGGERHRVADLLAADPEAVAGPELVAAAGPTLGVLVKLLDAASRLPVHAHPARAFARRHLGSLFGKAEAWIVLETRSIRDEPPPHVRLGFARDVGRDELRDWIERRDSNALLGSLNCLDATAGDVWFVPAGVLHAIGAGVFIAEIQEPTDFSIVAELRDFPVDPAAAHLGLGWDVAIDAIQRRAFEPPAPGRLDRPGTPNTLRPLLPDQSTPYFRADRLDVDGAARPDLGPAFVVGLVTSGRGAIRVPGGNLDVKTGATFALPAAAARDTEFKARDGMRVLLFRAPRPVDLAAGSSP